MTRASRARATSTWKRRRRVVGRYFTGFTPVRCGTSPLAGLRTSGRKGKYVLVGHPHGGRSTPIQRSGSGRCVPTPSGRRNLTSPHSCGMFRGASRSRRELRLGREGLGLWMDSWIGQDCCDQEPDHLPHGRLLAVLHDQARLGATEAHDVVDGARPALQLVTEAGGAVADFDDHDAKIAQTALRVKASFSGPHETLENRGSVEHCQSCRDSKKSTPISSLEPWKGEGRGWGRFSLSQERRCLARWSCGCVALRPTWAN